MKLYPDLRGMTAAFTGHRPLKFGGYGLVVESQLTALADFILTESRPSHVITGMALGWDQAVAYTALRRKIRVTAAIPFKGQESMWPEHSKTRYQKILDKCAEVKIVCPGDYASAKMQIRNQWMVDHSDTLIALWNGSSGGTANCVEYAIKTGKPVVHLWPEWQAKILGKNI